MDPIDQLVEQTSVPERMGPEEDTGRDKLRRIDQIANAAFDHYSTPERFQASPFFGKGDKEAKQYAEEAGAHYESLVTQQEGKLPGFGEARGHFDKNLFQQVQQHNLDAARERFKNAPEDTASYLARKAVPFAATVRNNQFYKSYLESSQKVKDGRASEDDYNNIAAYERIGQKDRDLGTAGQIGEGILGGGRMIGEFALVNKGLSAAGGLIGKAAGFGGVAAPAAGAVAPLTGGGLIGTAGTVGGFLGKTALSASLTPSMVLEKAQQNAKENGGRFTDMDNLAPAIALGTLQTAIFGSLAEAGNIPGSGMAKIAERIGVKTGLGLIEQTAADAIGGAAGLQTGYGLLGDLAEGKFGQAAKHTAINAITFAALSSLHAGNPEKVLKTTADAMTEMKKTGIGTDLAAQVVNRGVEVAKKIAAENPGATPEQLAKEVEKKQADGPVRDLAKDLVSEIKQPTKNEGPASPEFLKKLTASMDPEEAKAFEEAVNRPEAKPTSDLDPINQAISGKPTITEVPQKPEEAAKDLPGPELPFSHLDASEIKQLSKQLTGKELVTAKGLIGELKKRHMDDKGIQQLSESLRQQAPENPAVAESPVAAPQSQPAQPSPEAEIAPPERSQEPLSGVERLRQAMLRRSGMAPRPARLSEQGIPPLGLTSERTREEKAAIGPAEVRPIAETNRKELLARIEAGEGGLTTEESEILKERLVNATPYRQIGKAIDMSYQTVKNREASALKKLGHTGTIEDLNQGTKAAESIGEVIKGKEVAGQDMHVVDPDGFHHNATLNRLIELHSESERLDAEQKKEMRSGRFNDERKQHYRDKRAELRRAIEAVEDGNRKGQEKQGPPGILSGEGERRGEASVRRGDVGQLQEGATPGQAGPAGEGVPERAQGDVQGTPAAAGERPPRDNQLMDMLRKNFGSVEQHEEEPGQMVSKIGDRVVSARINEANNSVRLDFGYREGGGRDPFDEKIGARLSPGTVDFARKLVAFAKEVGESGLGISYSADPRRSEAYERSLPKAGFFEVSGKTNDAGEYESLWRPKEPRVATGEREARDNQLNVRERGAVSDRLSGEVERTLNDMPRPLVDKLKQAGLEITLAGKHADAPDFPGINDVGGAHYVAGKLIVVDSHVSKGQERWALIHELGHAVDDLLLGSQSRSVQSEFSQLANEEGRTYLNGLGKKPNKLGYYVSETPGYKPLNNRHELFTELLAHAIDPSLSWSAEVANEFPKTAALVKEMLREITSEAGEREAGDNQLSPAEKRYRGRAVPKAAEAEADKEGISADDLHGMAKQIRAEDAAGVEQANAVLKEIRDQLPGKGKLMGTENYREWSDVPGLEEVAQQFRDRGRGELGDPNRMFELLQRGNEKPLTEQQVYDRAIEQLRAREATAKPETPAPVAQDTGFEFGANAVVDAAVKFLADESGALNLNALGDKAKEAYQTIKRSAEGFFDHTNKLAGAKFPKISRLSEAAGNALARMDTAREMGRLASADFIDRVLGKDVTPEQARLWGSAFHEERFREAKDNFRQASAGYSQAAAGARAVGDMAGAAKWAAKATEYLRKATHVRDFIGSKDSSIKTEPEFQQIVNSPEYKEMMKRYETELTPSLEQWFKQAEGMAETDPINSLTQIQGRPFSAKVIEEGPQQPEFSGPGARGSLANRKLNKLGAAREAELASGNYETDLREMISHTIQGRVFLAKKAEAYRIAEAEGIVTWAKPGERVSNAERIDGVNPPKGTQAAKNGETDLWVTKERDAHNEFRQALRIDKAATLPIIKQAADASTVGALISTMEATFHTLNNLTAVFKAGVNPLDVVTNLVKVTKGDPETMKRLVELASIGVAKEGHAASAEYGKWDPRGWTGRFLETLDKSMRLTLDKGFDRLSDGYFGVKALGDRVAPTEANRRDFINQLGNYSKGSQSRLVVLLRDLGIGPFATAGTNYIMQGVRAVTGNTGVEAANWKQAVGLRAEQYARVLSVVGATAIANYLAWGRWDGDDNTPLGHFKIGDAANGKTSTMNFSAFTGLPRGLRMLGILPVAEGIRKDKEAGQITDDALKAMGMSIAHPAFGPLPAFVYTGFTGKDLIGRQLAERVSTAKTPIGMARADAEGRPAPGSSQMWQNLKAALWHAVPALGTAFGKTGRPDEEKSGTDRALEYLGPFAPTERGPAPKKRRISR